MKKSIPFLLVFFTTNVMFSQFLPAGTATTDNKYRPAAIGIGYSALPTFGTNKFMVNGNADFAGNIIAGTASSTAGINAFSIRYGTESISNWGSLKSSSSTYMSFGVKASPTVADGWQSSQGTANIPKLSFVVGSSGFQFLTAPTTTQVIAAGTAVTMKEVMRIDEIGKVGIGTPNPISKLDVYCETDLGIRYNGIRTHRPGVFGQFAFMDYAGDTSIFGSSYTGAAGSYGKILFRQYGQNDVYRDAVVIDSSGDVGIGATTPLAKLHIDGLSGSQYFLQLGNTIKVKGDGVLTWGASSVQGLLSWDTGKAIVGAQVGQNLSLYAGGGEMMNINANGKVGIGTANPDEKLTVKGKIHAEEVRIDLLVPADYVFQKYYTGTSSLKSDYVMPTLDEVAQYTKVNNHLPSIPSAEEMKKNGVQLGEMNNLLLQKIEELTLYIIQQNDTLKKQSKEIENIKSMMVKKRK
jgi:hypothetical protein